MTENMYKVIIIGGGVAGLASMQKLVAKGVKKCIILEAQSHIGGRVKTVKHGQHYLEYGAHWIHGEDGNVVHALAAENRWLDEEETLKGTGVGDCIFVREDSSLVEEEIVTKFQSVMMELTYEGKNDLSVYKNSVGKYYSEKFKEVNKWGTVGNELLDWYGTFQNCIDGSDTWFDASGVGSTIYQECPGNPTINFKNGYQTLLNYFQSQIPEQCLHLNSPVERIFWKPNESEGEVKSGSPTIKVKLGSGQELYAEHVVVTPSLAVLKTSYQQLFEPALPSSKVKAIQDLGIGVVDKIFIEFPHRWWGKCDGFSFLRNAPESEFNEKNWTRGILGFYEVFKQPQMLCAWMAGKAAKEMEKCSLEEVRNSCMRLIRSYLASHYEIPEPTWLDRSMWFSNPYIRGSYSFRSLASESSNVTAEDLARPLLSKDGIPVVCFAGEATHSCYYSTVHGAVESGWREAERLLANMRFSDRHLSSKPCKGNHYEVVIVGAGASGLAAAKQFEANGIESILLLEACDQIGGRVKTLRTSSGGFIDLGAQWIHGQLSNDLYEMSAPLGLIGERLSVDGEGDFYTDKGEKLDDSLVREVLDMCEKIKEDCEDFASNGSAPPPSIGHYLKSRFEEYLNDEGGTPEERRLKEAIYHWNVRWERIDNACDSLHQLSCKRWGEYKFCEGFNNMNPACGMSSLLQRLKQDIKGELKLLTEVVNINYATNLICSEDSEVLREDGSPPVIVTCRNGDVYKANHVVVTCSLGFLKKHQDSFFIPPLPSTTSKAISRFGFGVIDKIFLEFETPFWGESCTGVHFVWTGDEIPDFNRTAPDTQLLNGQRIELKNFWYRGISGFDPVHGHRSMLCGWIAGPEAEYMETLEEKEVSRVCLDLLHRFTNNKDIPHPIAIYRSQWASSDFFLGSYSHKMAKWDHLETGLEEDLSHPILASTSQGEKYPVLTLAGEANSSNFFSTVHGALQSGSRQAEHYINFVNRLKISSKVEEKLMSKL